MNTQYKKKKKQEPSTYTVNWHEAENQQLLTVCKFLSCFAATKKTFIMIYSNVLT